MDLIIPAAGKSSRFPNMRPKWLLTHPDGSLMISAALKGIPLKKFERIVLIVLREHLEKYKCQDGIKKSFIELGVEDKLNLVILDKPTSSQPETVAQGLRINKTAGSFYIKDTDNYFEVEVKEENAVSTYNLNDLEEVSAANKSYVSKNDKGLITNIVEKEIISPEFCCGGYSFASAEDYLKVYDQLSSNKDLYVSHIIFQMMLNGEGFRTRPAKSYEDWGTKHAWDKYKSQFATLFLDIDGVLVENSGKYFSPQWGETAPIQKNVDLINRLYNTGKTEVILTTSRTEEFRDITVKQLQKIGLKYHRLICDLMHSKRIIVNDYARTNPYPSCSAINVQRNSDSELPEMLNSVLKSGGKND